MSIITIERHERESNDRVAAANRARLNEARLFAINMLSAPGAGKTSLVERTIEQLRPRLRLGVIVGDAQTDFDARRLARYDLPVVQILMHGGCHLDAKLVDRALRKLDLDALDLLVIENVDHLTCPAEVDLGEHLTTVVLSTAEGHDQPRCCPAALRKASALVINKLDQLPFLRCDMALMREHARQVNPDLEVFETSCTTNAGVAEWSDWLALHVERARQR